MLADPSFIEKLWNKGVDIAASVVASTISALIIAVIATSTWKFKRRRDLQLEEGKQRQQHRIAEEIKIEDQKKERREYIQRRARERDGCVAAFAGATDVGRLQAEWDQYLKWLTLNGIVHLPGNQAIVNANASIGRLAHPSAAPHPEWSKGIAEEVKRTELPPSELPG